MPIYQTATYQIKPQAVNKVKRAIQDFVQYVQANEPGTRIHMRPLPTSKNNPKTGDWLKKTTLF